MRYPTRVRAVTAPLSVLDVPGPVLTHRQTWELRNEMAGDLWREVIKGPAGDCRTLQEALDHLAPRPARSHRDRAAKVARRLGEDALDAVQLALTAATVVVAIVYALAVLAPLAYGLGV